MALGDTQNTPSQLISLVMVTQLVLSANVVRLYSRILISPRNVHVLKEERERPLFVMYKPLYCP